MLEIVSYLFFVRKFHIIHMLGFFFVPYRFLTTPDHTVAILIQ